MCREGGCGCCTVLLRRPNPTTRKEWVGAVNSCLVSIYSCHGFEVVTVEGVGGREKGYHGVQTRLAKMNGSQCGYCSPGMVMSMVGLMEQRKGKVAMEDVEKNFGGNICRCTGYRPILDAFKSLAEDSERTLAVPCPDIEELPIKCIFVKELYGQVQPDFVHFYLDSYREWFRVRNLDDIMKILGRFYNRPYMLVGGNTGHGVYRRREELELFVDISNVEELKITTIASTLEVGAAVTIADFIGILNEASKTRKDFSYCRQMANHLELVAHPAVRNVGTIGGNLMLKHEHLEFPSDIFLLLETVGAFLTIVDGNGMHRVVFVEDFLYKSMRHQLILKITLPPLDPEKYRFLSYKIMPRAENAHAIVNAGFLFKFNAEKTITYSARICYGGINPRFIHATKTENLLATKNLFTNETIMSLMTSLNEELKMDYNLPDFTPRYRKILAMGLLYRAIINLAPPGKVQDRLKSGAEPLFRSLSSGKQWVTAPENALPKIDALLQCSGEAMYINDMPFMRGEVWGAFVPATEISAHILDIDVTEALKIPGVVAFFCAKDIPGVNSYITQFFIEGLDFIEHEEVFCNGRVLYHSQPVGIIVAETLDLAKKAAKIVKITYTLSTQKRPLLSVKDVVESGNEERVFPFETRLEAQNEGNEGNDTATTISGDLKFSDPYHFHLEPQTTICIPTESGMEVHCGTHYLHLIHMGVTQVLNIPENSIDMKLKRIGGSFGAKISKSGHVACAAAVACHHLRRPVRFVLSIEENMMVIGKRFPSLASYKVEVNNEGKIEKLQITQIINMGVSRNEFTNRQTIINYMTGLYDSSTWSIDFKGAITDLHPHTWFRAPARVEAQAIIESIMEHIAKELHLDPLDVRLANMKEDSPMRTILTQFLYQCDFEERRKRIDAFNTANRWRKRGIAFVPMNYPIETRSRYGVLVTVYAIDGSVSVCHGGIEMGQGIDTKIIQITAKMFGIPINWVNVKPANNLVNANVSPTVGSQTMDAVGRLVIEACNIILERIKPVRDEIPTATWAELVQATFERNISLVSLVTDMDKESIQYNVWGAACAEIEIDVLTGDFLLQRVDIAEDVGESLNPNIDVGQIEGAFVMGLGYWLQEKIIRNPETGEILTNRTWNYKPPVARDIPVDFRVSFLKGQNLPAGIIGAKATGEPAICMSIVAVFALRNALESARKDAGLPFTFIELHAPTTKEDILLLSGTQITQFQLSI
ncbi:uncharacterized protein LOC129792886 [Lutzomyia longipalpis]|uniref:uncharacterized protein LOC129792886 n=1 Tax=Lutzomyia longipalpis TaxID=7200 RepID=UPI002483FCED|nr:uncharacterized protein LOC129792886 [Lutzomyia longipalpis]XP_055688261.1 uncharacterized protein LOC129792886 [Lutzomyia longipalpis]